MSSRFEDNETNYDLTDMDSNQHTERSLNETDNEENEINVFSTIEVCLREWKQTNVCPECGIRINNNNISRHIKEKHTGLKYECDKCKQMFCRKDYLAKHKCKKYDNECTFVM